MKKYLFLLALAAVIIILSSCTNQVANQTNQAAPSPSGNKNSAVLPKNINAGTSGNTNAQPGVTKDELDKLKADINKLQSDNPNGLSQWII